ncbi:MAG: diguanylate cyclase [Lachnospiraceae bacterium]|nr:diguanylate cyclase [Lachnospiraceae bacterium]
MENLYWIAVVDDDTSSLKLIRTMLTDKGMRVSVMRSGKDLLTFVERHIPDLILLDIMMPEMDGFETYRLLREHEIKDGLSNVPVIFLTGDSDMETEHKGLELGAADFIRKPVNYSVLMQRIHNTVSNSKAIVNLTEAATVDFLTGILNKASGTEELTKACLNDDGALMVLDLDSFKLVNDLYGHDVGDKVLSSFADILRTVTRPGDILCRLGGDEFAVFLRNVYTEEPIERISNQLNEKTIIRCFELLGEDHNIPTGVSLGACFVPKCGRDYQECFKASDEALYTVKQNGKHGFTIYDPDYESEPKDDSDPDKEIHQTMLISNERGRIDEPMCVGLDAFTAIYRYNIRVISDFETNACLILFSISIGEGEKELLTKAAEQFTQILTAKLKSSDVIMRRRLNRIYVLVSDCSLDKAYDLAKGFIDGWQKNEFSSDIQIGFAIRELEPDSSKEECFF